jgi:hypothetical protein
MTLDLLIRGGTVVDGSGSAGRRADVGVRDGRIVVVGDADGSATQTIDADGLVVAPGIIDLHTHYDAQLCWDPYASPSSLHSTTTVVGGNCGFSIAPVREDDRDYMTRLLARVEGMPLDSLLAAVPWDWRTFAEYLDRFEGRLGVTPRSSSAPRRFAASSSAPTGNEPHPRRSSTPCEVFSATVSLPEASASQRGPARPTTTRLGDRCPIASPPMRRWSNWHG